MDAAVILHASCVAIDGQGLLITGPAGSGKSSLALALMALGAGLVADDRTRLESAGAAGVIASCPETISGLIEARGLGLLRAVPAGPTPLALVVEMGQTEESRLPPFRQIILAGRTMPLVHSQRSPHFPAALMQYIRGGRHA